MDTNGQSLQSDPNRELNKYDSQTLPESMNSALAPAVSTAEGTA